MVLQCRFRGASVPLQRCFNAASKVLHIKLSGASGHRFRGASKPLRRRFSSVRDSLPLADWIYVERIGYKYDNLSYLWHLGLVIPFSERRTCDTFLRRLMYFNHVMWCDCLKFRLGELLVGIPWALAYFQGHLSSKYCFSAGYYWSDFHSHLHAGGYWHSLNFWWSTLTFDLLSKSFAVKIPFFRCCRLDATRCICPTFIPSCMQVSRTHEPLKFDNKKVI